MNTIFEPCLSLASTEFLTFSWYFFYTKEIPVTVASTDQLDHLLLITTFHNLHFWTEREVGIGNIGGVQDSQINAKKDHVKSYFFSLFLFKLAQIRNV